MLWQKSNTADGQFSGRCNGQFSGRCDGQCKRVSDPIVIHDTFDCGTPSPPLPLLTQASSRPSNGDHAPTAENEGEGVDVAHEAGPLSNQNAEEESLPPSSPERSPSPWGSSETVRSSSPISLDFTTTPDTLEDEADRPSPTERAALARRRARAARPVVNPVDTFGHVNPLIAEREHQSQAGTDYFGFFSSPPAFIDPPHITQNPIPGIPRNKGKECAVAPGPEQDDEDQERTGMHDAGWCEAQLLEARQQSLRQVLQDRAGPNVGSSDAAQWTGHDSANWAMSAGPCRTEGQYTWRFDGAGTFKRTLRDDHPSQPILQGRGTVSVSGPSQHHSQTADDTCTQPHDQRDRRASSEYRLAPNTRAAHDVHPLPQHSPISRVANLNHTPTPSGSRRRSDDTIRRAESSRYAGNPRHKELPRRESPGHFGVTQDMRMDTGKNPFAMEDDRQSNEPRREWLLEDGEVLPAALREEDLELDGDPTDIPDGGFPTIHRDDVDRGMARDWTCEVWRDPPYSSVLIEVFNYRYSKEDAFNMRVEGSVRCQFKLISGKVDFDVVPPELLEGLHLRNRDLPTIWAVRRLTPRGVARVLARSAWSFPSISFLFFLCSATIPTWLFMLEGLLPGDEARIRAAIMRVLREPQMRTWIEQMVSANPEFAAWSLEDAMGEVLGSLRVETLQLGNGNYVANAWMCSPTRDVKEWRRWVAELRSRHYRTFAIGTGRVRAIIACSRCRSVSHPQHLCPFLRIRGWNGPEPGDGVFGEY
ncbi:hypothetical protein C8T65DRAFT_746800 [Cerioporus squamosus]|nr:hypothetical protein C8T65DRAFT_746800 [Cerioporus squamosus]